ncbi:hypothetical protein GCM10011490_26060 [Pseudoclavibacter endophyticus]|nr:hypothetical protein GCM10011490_26060 [Pseudoclavibacter endophyticus]
MSIIDDLDPDGAAFIVELLAAHDRPLLADLSRDEVLTHDRYMRLHSAFANGLEFLPPDWEPTPRTLRIERLVDKVVRLWVEKYEALAGDAEQRD